MKLVKKILPALTSSHYRRYFLANLISFTGTWIYRVVFGYLIYDVTRSAIWVGAIGAASFAPSLFLSLYAGALVDRINKKKFILFTQSLQGLIVAIFAVFHSIGFMNPWVITLVAALLGITETFDLPARQSYVIKMVGKELLPSAIALNGTAFNMARVVGPAIAGIALIWVGITGILIINSLSFFAVVIAIYSMRISESPKMQKAHPVNAIQKGLSYVLNHSMIKPMIFLTAMCSIFGWPYSTLLPVFAKDVLGQGASGLGYLYSSAGLGAVVGSLITSTFSVRFGTTRFVFVGMVLAGLSILSLSFANNIALAFSILFLTGFSMVLTFSMLNATVQMHVEDEFRGRVMGVYSMMLVGVGSLGAILMGMLSEWLGIESTFFLCGGTLFITSLIALRYNKHLIV